LGRNGASDPIAVVINLRIANAVRREGPALTAKHVASAGNAAVGIDDGMRRRPISGGTIGIDLVVDHALRFGDDVRTRVIQEQSEPAEIRPDRIAEEH
jgi:hypothetical protein